MNSVLTDEQKHQLNYNVPLIEQRHAAAALKYELGIKAEEIEVIIWKVKGEYLRPRAFVDRVKEGYYDKETSGKRPDKTGEDREVDVQSRKGRPDRPLLPDAGVLRNTDKRRNNKRRSSRNGSGGSETVRGRDTRLAVLARAEAKLVRKQRSSISEVEDNNDTDQKQVERKIKSRTDKSKPRGTRQPTRTRQKTLRRSNKSRLSSKTRVRRGRS